jgi:hypothetical protein
MRLQAFEDCNEVPQGTYQYRMTRFKRGKQSRRTWKFLDVNFKLLLFELQCSE